MLIILKEACFSGHVVASVLGALLRDAYKDAKAAGDKPNDLWCKEQENGSYIYFFGI